MKVVLDKHIGDCSIITINNGRDKNFKTRIVKDKYLDEYIKSQSKLLKKENIIDLAVLGFPLIIGDSVYHLSKFSKAGKIISGVVSTFASVYGLNKLKEKYINSQYKRIDEKFEALPYELKYPDDYDGNAQVLKD